MNQRKKSILISGAFILLVIVVAIVDTLTGKKKTENRTEQKSGTVDLERRTLAKDLPSAYINFAKTLDPNSATAEDAPKLTCRRQGHMFLIACPGKGWTGSADDEVYWGPEEEERDGEENPEGFLRLHIYNNCVSKSGLVFRAVGKNIPERLQEGLKIKPKTPAVVDIPYGFSGKIFSQSGCINKDCQVCPQESDDASPFGCSTVDMDVDLRTGDLSYQTNNSRGFSTAYILSSKDEECPSSGGGLLFSNRKILNQCPDTNAIKGRDGFVTTCLSNCEVCQLAEAIRTCQCRMDDDCADCSYARDFLPGDSVPPLQCVQNRCRSKLDCSKKYKTMEGDLTASEFFCKKK